MTEDPAASVQLLLAVPVFTLEGIGEETRRRLVAALADLLLAVALHGHAATKGGGDEREDP
jgi:hypothetical protein